MSTTRHFFRTAVWATMATITLAGCAQVPAPHQSGASIGNRSEATLCQLSGWHDDSHAEVIPALRQSCQAILTRPPTSLTRRAEQIGRVEDWGNLCRALERLPDDTNQTARIFLERWLTPVGLSAPHDQGILTGYHSVKFEASRRRTLRFRFPIYSPPAGSGRKPTRAQAAQGALAGLELLWLDSPIDGLWLDLNGSGVARLNDGGTVLVTYAGQNGHRPRFITEVMAAHGIAASHRSNREAVHRWALHNPKTAARLIVEDPSMVYFALREDDGSGPPGALGVPLREGRSLAVDPEHVALATLVWVDAGTVPALARPFRRIMAAQDVGGAIKGRHRGDVFWGADDSAIAPRFKTIGQIIPLAARSQPLPGPGCSAHAETDESGQPSAIASRR